MIPLRPKLAISADQTAAELLSPSLTELKVAIATTKDNYAPKKLKDSAVDLSFPIYCPLKHQIKKLLPCKSINQRPMRIYTGSYRCGLDET